MSNLCRGYVFVNCLTVVCQIYIFLCIDIAMRDLVHNVETYFAFVERGSSVCSMSAPQVAVPPSILASGTFFHGKIISLFH